ncbi:hypothetical protein BsWGS_09253 [Bradybaena similaris]
MEDDVKKWMEFKELQDRNRCIKCKLRLDEAVMCERCLEFKYCSIHCLEDDRDDHLKYCNMIGLLKGRLTRLTDEEGQFREKVKEKARLLNEDGAIRTPQGWFSQEGENSSEEEDDDNTHVGAKKSESRENKNKGSRTDEGKYRDSSSNRPEVKEQKEKLREETLLKTLTIDGQFGEAVTAKKVLSGESFGKGWWNPLKTKSKADRTSSDDYSASSGDSTEKLNDTNEEENAASSLATTSPIQVPLEEGLAGLQIVKYDNKLAGERPGSAQTSSTLGKCLFCRKEGPVLKCSRCKLATYCDKDCQKKDYKNHSNKCKRKAKFDTALSQVPHTLKISSILFMGSFEVSPILAAIPDEFSFMLLGPRCHAIVEIIDFHPHPFRYGAIVKDLIGETTQVLFYTDTPYYNHKMPGIFMPIPLSLCIQPGNFILLLDAHWHYFLDGTRGIRIDDLSNIFFIFMDK